MLRTIKKDDDLPFITKEIDQTRMNNWAEISGDFNRLHVDPEYAKASRFEGTIAHGPMSLAFLNELMMKCFDEWWAIEGKLLDVRFVAPVRPGDTIRIGGTIVAVKEADGKRTIECDLFVKKNTDETAVVGRGVVRIPEVAE